MAAKRKDYPALGGGAILDAESWIAECWADMRECAKRSDEFCAEDYLSLAGPVDAALAIDVIYAEFVLKAQSAAQPAIDDYLRRFPQYTNELQRQLQLDEALSSLDVSVDDTLSQGTQQTSDNSPVPTHIGKYVVVAPAGKGGQANVYRAVHPDLGNEVIIKVAANGFNEANNKGQILAEGKILVELSHPAIAKVYDFDFSDDRPYLVIEYIRGRTLEQYVKQQSPDVNEICRLIREIADALAYAHRRGVLHLDIKPSNILVDEKGLPHLIDFGLGLVNNGFEEESIEAGDLRGTLPYMATEQARGESDSLDARADIFGLGSVLYFCVTGKPPYETKPILSLMADVSDGNWHHQRLSDTNVPDKLKRVIEKAMHRQPALRYHTCDEIAADLARVPRNQRLREISRLAAVVACVAGLALFCVLWNPHTSPRLNVPQFGGEAAQTATIGPSSIQVKVIDGESCFDLVHRVPLKTGDLVQVVGRVPKHHHVSLFLVSSPGEVELLLQRAPSDSEQLTYPIQAGHAVPLHGIAGTELLVLCGKPASPMTRDDFVALIDSDSPLPMLPPATVLSSDGESVFVLQQDRGFGESVALSDSQSVVSHRMDEIRESLKKQGCFCSMLAFHHAQGNH